VIARDDAHVHIDEIVEQFELPGHEVGFLVVASLLPADVLLDVLVDVILVEVGRVALAEFGAKCEMEVEEMQEDEVILALVIVEPVDRTIDEDIRRSKLLAPLAPVLDRRVMLPGVKSFPEIPRRKRVSSREACRVVSRLRESFG